MIETRVLCLFQSPVPSTLQLWMQFIIQVSRHSLEVNIPHGIFTEAPHLLASFSFLIEKNERLCLEDIDRSTKNGSPLHGNHLILLHEKGVPGAATAS